MYSIQAESLSKKFNRYFLLRDFSYTFYSGKSYALTGHNGSGKSTLLQILAGIQLPTHGKLDALHNNTSIADQLYRHLNFSAPYSEVIEEYTLQELLTFHTTLKPFHPTVNLSETLKHCGLDKHLGKEIRWYSSGMKQRVKLLLSVFSEAPLLFLDEPTSNMDEAGIEWYRSIIQQYKTEKLLIIASNQRNEYDFCDEVINITDYNK